MFQELGFVEGSRIIFLKMKPFVIWDTLGDKVGVILKRKLFAFRKTKFITSYRPQLFQFFVSFLSFHFEFVFWLMSFRECSHEWAGIYPTRPMAMWYIHLNWVFLIKQIKKPIFIFSSFSLTLWSLLMASCVQKQETVEHMNDRKDNRE